MYLPQIYVFDMMTRKIVIILVVVCVSLVTMFFFRWSFSAYESHRVHRERLKYYPLLQRTGKTLPELLKLDNIKEVWQLCTNDPAYTLSCYVTNEMETRVAEESLKNLFRESESLILYQIEDNYGRGVEVKDSSLNVRLGKVLRFESGIFIFTGVGAGLYERYIVLQPSGLHLLLFKDKVRLVDSGGSYTCDTQCCLDFVDLLECVFARSGAYVQEICEPVPVQEICVPPATEKTD